MSIEDAGRESQGDRGCGCGCWRGGVEEGPWTAAEDEILTEYVRRHGEGNWNAVRRNTGLLRCGKSCRLRWMNHLRPDLKKGSFTPRRSSSSRASTPSSATSGPSWPPR
uniref:Uncharacterized protein n=1 Tax=Ananas comosus var. bracteatus TaxID=296719 RepID=A0A6V7NKR8_ANACO|nr:unnamed protein product [Ananas comosus var. bracteatus]